MFTKAERFSSGVANALAIGSKVSAHFCFNNHGLQMDVTLVSEGNIVGVVTSLGGLRTAVQLGDVLAIPADMFVGWTCK